MSNDVIDIQAESVNGVEDVSVSDETIQQKGKSKKVKAVKPVTDKPVKVTKVKSDQTLSHDRVKRGPARPHRRLQMEVIELRISKLQKRIDRVRNQIEDASRHIEGYLRERDFRSKEGNLN